MTNWGYAAQEEGVVCRNPCLGAAELQTDGLTRSLHWPAEDQPAVADVRGLN